MIALNEEIIARHFLYNTTLFSVGTSYVDILEFFNVAKQVDTDMIVELYVAGYNATDAWGGGHIKLMYSEDNGGSWVDDQGASGACVAMSTPYGGRYARTRNEYQKIFLLDALTTNQLKIKLQAKSYAGTFTNSIITAPGADLVPRFATTCILTEIKRVGT